MRSPVSPSRWLFILLALFFTSSAVALSPTTTTLTATTPTSLFYGQLADGVYAVQVADPNFPPTGLVSVQDNGIDVPVCTRLPYGANCPYGNPILLDAGTHALTVTYLGDNVNAPSISAPVFFFVRKGLTTIALTTSLTPALQGAPVTFTALMTSNYVTPVGNVTFLDGTVTIGTATHQNGTATVTTSTLSPGTHSITVDYQATTNFEPATSAPLSQTILPLFTPDPNGFSLTVTPNPISIGVGRTGLLTVTVIDLTGFSQPVQLSCSNLAPETSCVFTQPTMPPGGGSATLQLLTNAPRDCGTSTPYFLGRSTPPTLPIGAPILLSAIAVFLTRRRTWKLKLPILLLAVLLPSLSGCGHCTDLGTRPGTYTFTVIAASPGGPTHSTQVRLTMTIGH